MPRSPIGHPVAVLLAGALFASLAAADTGDLPESVLERLKAAELDREQAVSVKRLDVDLGAATLTLSRGVLIPAKPVEGRVVELAFAGSGQLFLDPGDPIEANQLQLFSGAPVVDAEIARAVLVFGDATVASRLLADGARIEDETTLDPAEQFFAAWNNSGARANSGAQTGMFKAVLGDDAYRRYVFAYLERPEGGPLHYRRDPGSYEPISLGQSAPPTELDDLLASLEDITRGGRFKVVRVGGPFEDWTSMPDADAAGNPLHGSAGFEPVHYENDLHVDVDNDVARGRTRVTLRPTGPGRRVASFVLYPRLDVNAVRDAESNDLFCYREGGQLHVVLPEPAPLGADLVLEIDYAGPAFRKIEGGVFVLRSTHGWYPRIGTIDRATCDTTLRWRNKTGFQGFASGRKVDEGIDDRIVWRRFVLDVPSFGCSVEVGKFEVHEARVGHVDLTVAFSTLHGRMDGGGPKEVVATIGDALTFFEEKFGAYPLDHLSVVTLPRRFSQGSLGFVTLADTLLRVPSGYRSTLSADERRRERTETIAHELSHQWWGNKVGWASYRDQWLSEALASFSATIYGAARADSRAAYLTAAAREWRTALGENAVASNGWPLESIGPVVLGGRLRSRIADAYVPVVYTKGSIVFSMLARNLGQEPFLAMLEALADRVDNRVIDTDVFLRSLERMSGTSLRNFADQFVYGTGIPDVFYDYEIRARDDGGWLIEGTARRVQRSRFSVALVRTDEGGWDVVRSRVAGEEAPLEPLVVPFQIALSGQRSTKKKPATLGLGGDLRLEGRESAFRIPTDREPAHFWLDQRGEVLAFFRDARSFPKSALMSLAETQPDATAVRTLRAALEAPLYSPAMQEARKLSDRQVRKQAEPEDADIHLDLADLRLNAGQVEPARGSLERAVELLGRIESSRPAMTVKARVQLRQRDYTGAYETMDEALSLNPFWPRRSFGRRRADAYAINAVAAYETDRLDEARRFASRAERAGVDMSALSRLLEDETEEDGRRRPLPAAQRRTAHLDRPHAHRFFRDPSGRSTAITGGRSGRGLAAELVHDGILAGLGPGHLARDRVGAYCAFPARHAFRLARRHGGEGPGVSLHLHVVRHGAEAVLPALDGVEGPVGEDQRVGGTLVSAGHRHLEALAVELPGHLPRDRERGETENRNADHRESNASRHGKPP